MNTTGILSAIGQTPLIRLERLYPEFGVEIFAKLEYLNPSGSIKDRTSVTILQEAFRKGKINANTVIIESTSGNMGVGLAQVCKYLGLKLILIVDPLINPATERLLLTYGVAIQKVTKADESGTYLTARLSRITQLLEDNPNYFWTNQYSNRDTLLAHRKTATELLQQVEDLDFLFVATSTCGTIMGCATAIRALGKSTKIIPVDAVGSKIFQDESAKRKIPGMGASRKSDFLEQELLEAPYFVDDLQSVSGCHKLLDREAILAGGSTGAVVAALEEALPTMNPNSKVAFFISDRGERYLDTIYSDQWIADHLYQKELSTPSL